MKSSQFHQNPLCVFCLSPAFSVRAFVRPSESSASRRLSTNRSRRRDDWPLSFTRSRHSRFRPCNRHPSNSISKHLASGAFSRHQRKLLSLQEILAIVQRGWRSSQVDAEKPRKQEVSTKATDSSSSDMSSSPVLIRRRLSAPETIMRKHTLAQQQSHSDSQDSEETQLSYKSCQWRSETGAGSDFNLNRKRDADVIRKSTLLRRLWNKSTNSCKFSGTFYEWQHSSGKLSTHSSASVHSSSSPEHLVRSLKNVRKMSPTRQIYDANRNPTSPKRKLSNIDTYSDDTAPSKSTTTFTPRTATTETKYTNTSNNSNFSDSAYMNSTCCQSSNNNSTLSEIKHITEPPEVVNQSSSITQPKLLQSDSTQTQETTNVNVISNVQLSQSTLDLIFNQVIQDVQKSPENTTRQSFYLKRKEDVVIETPEHNRIIKYMISNIGTGSPYSKPAEIPQLVVPRFSALPRTSSMEVNISSGSEIDDRESDVSLVDSLEDQSPRISLPDNSERKAKPTAFFIPIQVESDASFKAVSELLPDKVRNKLIKRQVKREEKRKSASKTDSNYASDSNSNIIDYEVASTPSSKKKKPRSLLPNIDNYRKAKPSDRKEFNKFRTNHYKSRDKNENEKKPWVPKTKSKEKLLPLYSSDYAPKRIYRKTEFNNSNKRIEILEIMECVEPPQIKSKIPVSVNQRLPKLGGTPKNTPAFFDINNDAVSDPKLDQLIANILIDTLNAPNQEEVEKNSLPKKFEMIPEESAGQTEDVNENVNINKIENNPDQTGGPYQGKAAVAVVRDENFSSIPKGWITFYMLHNNRGSPDSTSDEGKKLMDKANARKASEQDNNVETSRNSDKSNELTRNELASINNAFLELVRKDLLDDFTSSSDKLSQPDLNGKYKKCSSQQRKQRHRSGMVLDNSKFGKWSVTVSGSNSYGQVAPDLEMCLKFPESHRISSNQSDSGLGEENVVKKFHRQIPRFSSKTTKGSRAKPNENCEESLLPHGLPDINHNKLIKKRPKDDPGPGANNPLNHLAPSKSEPRQTRTSSRRYDLSRHKAMEYRTPEIQTSDDINTLFNERQYAEILRRFPEILKVTGNAIRQTKHV